MRKNDYFNKYSYQEALEWLCETSNLLDKSLLKKKLQELIDKEKPKKVSIEFEDFDYELSKFGCDYYICSKCDSVLYEDTEHLKINDYKDNFNQDIKYCHCCGQKLDWGEKND